MHLHDGTSIWLSGADIVDASLLYEFLARIEDAPGALLPMAEPAGSP